MLKVATVSGTVAGLVVAAAWTFQYLVFELPDLLGSFVARSSATSVFLVTLRWVNGIGARVRVLGAWAVLVPFVGAAAAFLVRGSTAAAS